MNIYILKIGGKIFSTRADSTSEAVEKFRRMTGLRPIDFSHLVVMR